MSEQKYIAKDLDDLAGVAQQLLSDFVGAEVFLLRGSMGAGKTTFIKSLVAQMGSEDAVTSPTFSIVNEYLDGEGESVFHFDLYRLERSEELMDIGFYEYLDSGRCIIEWPEMAEEYVPDDAVQVQILVEDGNRHFIVNQP